MDPQLEYERVVKWFAMAFIVMILISGYFLHRSDLQASVNEANLQIDKIIPTKNSGYLVVGYTSFLEGTTNIYMVKKVCVTKLNAEGKKLWKKNLNIENATGIQQLSDGSYLLIGFTGDYNNFRQIKINNSGDIEWEKSLIKFVRSPAIIKATDDGGFVLVFNTAWDTIHYSPRHQDIVYWVGKFNKEGKPEWHVCEPDPDNSEFAYARSVDADSRGGYLVAGSPLFYNTVKIINFSNQGRLLWKKYFNLPYKYHIYPFNDLGVASIKASADGSSIFAGTVEKDSYDLDYGDDNSTNIWVEKIDSTGSELWKKIIAGDQMNLACGLENTADLGYAVVGSTSSKKGYYSRNHGGTDVLMMKLRNNGSIEWQKLFGGSGKDVATGLGLTFDGGYIISAKTTSIDGDVHSKLNINKGWIIKLDSTGVIQWEKTTDKL